MLVLAGKLASLPVSPAGRVPFDSLPAGGKSVFGLPPGAIVVVSPTSTGTRRLATVSVILRDCQDRSSVH